MRGHRRERTYYIANERIIGAAGKNILHRPVVVLRLADGNAGELYRHHRCRSDANGTAAAREMGATDALGIDGEKQSNLIPAHRVVQRCFYGVIGRLCAISRGREMPKNLRPVEGRIHNDWFSELCAGFRQLVEEEVDFLVCCKRRARGVLMTYR